MNIATTVSIQLNFQIEENGTVYSDALYIPLSEYENVTEQEIYDMQMQRFDGWKLALLTPPDPEPEPIMDEESLIDQEFVPEEAVTENGNTV